MIINKRWRIMSSYEKIFRIVSISLSGIVLILATLGLSGILNIEMTNSITIPMIGVITLINGLTTYKENKSAGIFSICSAVFIFIIIIIVLAIKLLK